MKRAIEVGCNQGRIRDYDTLHQRMQEPEPRSKWGRIVALAIFIVLVTVVAFLQTLKEQA